MSSDPESTKPSRSRVLGGYVVILAMAVGLFLVVRHAGDGLVAAFPNTGHSAAPDHKVDALPHVLLALVVILVVSRALGWCFRKIRQPPVIGEVIAGICLGPSVLGLIAPGATQLVLPDAIAPSLGVIAQIGVVLFMFLVGLELDTSVLSKQSHATLFVSHASIIVPFLLGSASALWIYPRLGSSDVPFVVFALFMGVSMSVTAFPVLARILTDRGIQRTSLGVMALSCAAIDDVTAWCMLAFVVSVATGGGAHGGVLAGILPTLVLTLAYGLAVVFLVRPFVVREARKLDLVSTIGKTATTQMFVALLVSALITEWIGVHALFGAFLLGAVVPHDSRLAKDLTAKLEDVVTILFLPAFFAYTGMRTQIGLVSGVEAWMLCGGLVVIACLGKIGGSAFAARAVGLDWRSALQIGLLMNTRGLMALIVLNVGLDLGVLSPKLFAMLVVMALVTTFATAPGLDLLGTPEGERERRGVRAG